MKTVFTQFARLKNYFSQGNIYMAIANFFVTMFTWIAVLGLSFGWYFIIPIAGLSFVIFVGYFDFHCIKQHEVQHANTMNDMKDQLNRIEARL